MKALFLLTLLAGGSTAILYNVNMHPYWERSYSNEVQYSAPQVYGQLDEEHGWKTTIVYGEPLFDDCEQRTYELNSNDSLYDSYYTEYNTLQESYWPAPRYNYELDLNDLYLEPYRELEYYPLDLYSDFGYNPNCYDDFSY